MNQATGRIHSEYVKLQQEYSKLCEEKIYNDIENRRIQNSLEKRLTETKDQFNKENKRLMNIQKMLKETRDKSDENRKYVHISL